MQNLKDILELIKVTKLIQNYTDLNPSAGIKHRLAGIGTNEKSKAKQLTAEDTAAIKAGLQAMVKDINQAIELI